MGLTAVLGAEADQDDPSLADAELDDRPEPLEPLGAADEAGDRDVVSVVGVSGDDAAAESGAWYAGPESGRTGEVPNILASMFAMRRLLQG